MQILVLTLVEKLSACVLTRWEAFDVNVQEDIRVTG